MIVRYTDHAANERTFLAWIRTALAVMAFGAILARSDMYGRAATHSRSLLANAGLGCVCVGTLFFIAAYQRFRCTRATIGGDAARDLRNGVLEGVLVIALTAVGMALLVTLSGVKT